MLQFVECVYSGPLPAAVDLVIEHSLVCELVSTVLSHSRFFFLEGYGGSNWPCACEAGIGTTELNPQPSHSSFKTKWIVLCTFDCKYSVYIAIVLSLKLGI